MSSTRMSTSTRIQQYSYVQFILCKKVKYVQYALSTDSIRWKQIQLEEEGREKQLHPNKITKWMVLNADSSTWLRQTNVLVKAPSL